MSEPKTVSVEELRERVRRISSLLDDAHPGLVTWKLALYESINGFIDWWTEDERAADARQLSRLLKISKELLSFVESEFTGVGGRDLTNGTLTRAKALIARMEQR